MDVDLSRLRRGELIAGGGAIALLVSVFLLPWYGITPPPGWTAAALGVPTARNGWHGLMHLHWLIALTVLAALALVYFQATRRAPAVPVTISMITTLLGLLSSLALVYRVLINVPGPDDLIDLRVGAYVGLASALVIVYGGFESLRREGIASKDAPDDIETVSLQRVAESER